MTALTSLLQNPVVLTLAGVAAKAALIVGVAAATTHYMRWRRTSAAAQHLVWSASVIALLALPLLTATVPGWTVAVVDVPAPTVTQLEAPAITNSDAPTAIGIENSGAAFQPAADAVNAAAPQGGRRPLRQSELLLGIYLLGVFALLFRLALGSWSVSRLARQTTPVTDPTWLTLLKDLSWSMGVERPVRLLQSEDASIPMTWGTRHPNILLPVEANAWPLERRRAVLMHELAHVVRYDCLTQWLASFACAVYWVHPAAWYAARRLRVERERACDDHVIESGMQPRAYAAELFEVAQKYRGSGITAAAALGMARPSELEGRMLSLMDRFRSHHTASKSWVIAAAVGMAVIIVTLSCVQPGVAQASAAPELVAEPFPTTDAIIADEDDPDEPQDVQQTITRTVPARSGGTLILDLTTGGGLIIRGRDQNTVQVRAMLAGRDWRDTRVTVAPAGESTVRVESRQVSGRDNYSSSHNFEITVPRRQNVRIRSSGGSIDLSDIEGTFTGNTGGGEIVLLRLRGTANLTTGGGDIAVADSRLEGDVSTGGGDVQFRNVSGGIRGDGSGGRTEREGGTLVESAVGAPLRYRTAGGDVNIADAPTGADVQTGGGTIRITRAAGFVNARTGGGAITVGSVDGRVHATTGAGAVNVTMVGDPRRGQRDIEIHSGTGAVTLWLPDGIEAEFDIETAYTNNFGRRVRIQSDFPLRHTESATWSNDRGTPRKYVRASGRTGSATHKIRVRTVNGDVIVRRGSGRRTTNISVAGADSNTVYFDFQVDKQVVLLSEAPVPYPAALRASGIEGEVVAQFVVDALGRVNPSSFKVQRSSDDLFAAAVREAVLGMRFEPAEVGGRKVRQFVQMPFVFQLRERGSGGTGLGARIGTSTSTSNGSGFAFVTGQGSSRREAVRAMARNAPEAAAIAALERLAFEDDDPEVQREATRELAKFRDIYALRPLLRIALDHPGEEARREAATSLGVLATDEAIRTLQNMIVADEDVGVQRDAVRALGATHDRTDVRRSTTPAQIRAMLEQLADSHGNGAIRTLVGQTVQKLGRVSGEL